MIIDLANIRRQPVLIDRLVDAARQETIRKMTAILVETQTYADHDAAFEALRAHGFRIAAIVMNIDDARQAAMQDVVAREMGEA